MTNETNASRIAYAATHYVVDTTAYNKAQRARTTTRTFKTEAAALKFARKQVDTRAGFISARVTAATNFRDALGGFIDAAFRHIVTVEATEHEVSAVEDAAPVAEVTTAPVRTEIMFSMTFTAEMLALHNCTRDEYMLTRRSVRTYTTHVHGIETRFYHIRNETFWMARTDKYTCYTAFYRYPNREAWEAAQDQHRKDIIDPWKQ